jgi:hypothetical protein
LLPGRIIRVSCLYARVTSRQSGDRRPVELVASLGREGEEPVMQEARERQRHAQLLGRSKREADIPIDSKSIQIKFIPL